MASPNYVAYAPSVTFVDDVGGSGGTPLVATNFNGLRADLITYIQNHINGLKQDGTVGDQHAITDIDARNGVTPLSEALAYANLANTTYSLDQRLSMLAHIALTLVGSSGTLTARLAALAAITGSDLVTIATKLSGTGAVSFATVTATTFTGNLTGNVTGNATTVTSAALSAISDGRAAASVTPDTVVHFAAENMETTGGVPFVAPATTYDFAGHMTPGFQQWVILSRDTTTTAGVIQATFGAGVPFPGSAPVMPSVTTTGWVIRCAVFITGSGVINNFGGGTNFIQDFRGLGAGGPGSGSGTANNSTIKSSITSATLNQILSNGVSPNFYTQLALGSIAGTLTLQASASVSNNPAVMSAVSVIVNGEMRTNTAPVTTNGVAPGSTTVYYLVADSSGAGPGFTIVLIPTGGTVGSQQSVVATVVFDTVSGGFNILPDSIGRFSSAILGSANYQPLTFYQAWSGGPITTSGAFALCPGMTPAAKDFVATMRGKVQFNVLLTQGGTTPQIGTFAIQFDGAGIGNGLFQEVIATPTNMTVGQFVTVSGQFNFDNFLITPGRHTFGLSYFMPGLGGTTAMTITNGWLRGEFSL